MGSDPRWERDSWSRVPSFQREGSDPIIPAPRAGVVLTKRMIFLNNTTPAEAAPRLSPPQLRKGVLFQIQTDPLPHQRKPPSRIQHVVAGFSPRSDFAFRTLCLGIERGLKFKARYYMLGSGFGSMPPRIGEKCGLAPIRFT